MRMTYTQYSLQLHIHINTASNYILHVNVILFKQTRKGNAVTCSVFSAGSLKSHSTVFQQQARCSSWSSLGGTLASVLMKEVKSHSVKVKKQEMLHDRRAASAKMNRCV